MHEARPKIDGVGEKTCRHYESVWALLTDGGGYARRQSMRLYVKPYGEDWEAVVEAGRWARATLVFRDREAAQRWCEWMADRLAGDRRGRAA